MAEESPNARRAMMRYYRWTANSEGNSSVDHLRIKGWKDDFELAQRLDEGRPFREGEWVQEAPADWSEDGPLTDLLFDPRFHVVSPRLKALLEDLGLGSEIQFLPIRMKGEKTGREVGIYYVANYLRRIPCLHLEHSIYTVFGPDWIRPEQRGQISGVLKPALRRDAVGEARLFRVDEYEYIVVIHEDVKRAMEEAGITGCYFSELEVV
jgi:hypothetical protein